MYYNPINTKEAIIIIVDPSPELNRVTFTIDSYRHHKKISTTVIRNIDSINDNI